MQWLTCQQAGPGPSLVRGPPPQEAIKGSQIPPWASRTPLAETPIDMPNHLGLHEVQLMPGTKPGAPGKYKMGEPAIFLPSHQLRLFWNLCEAHISIL